MCRCQYRRPTKLRKFPFGGSEKNITIVLLQGNCGSVCLGTTPICCGGHCYDGSNDATECGSCGNNCESIGPGGYNFTTPACCAGTCRDLNSNEQNCGACGTACNAGGNPMCCNGLCTDASIDPNNCDGCGNVCAMGDICCGGVCTPSADTGAQGMTATENCGACGNDCNNDPLVNGGGQSPYCCDSLCVDIFNNNSNCGGCGITCSTPSQTCSGGTCISLTSDTKCGLMASNCQNIFGLTRGICVLNTFGNDYECTDRTGNPYHCGNSRVNCVGSFAGNCCTNGACGSCP